MNRIPPAEAQWQQERLNEVARTFALTLRPLPGALRHQVVNLYLLCRIADTVEDDPALDGDERAHFGERFVAAVEGTGDPEAFARDLAPRLISREEERVLVAATGRVVGITARFDPASRNAMERCVRVMMDGMVEFGRRQNPGGLKDQDEVDRYCYFVAGVVGEALTTLFCEFSPETAAHREGLEADSRAFGEGLQLVNILKDTWVDRERGACWLPADLFESHGAPLEELDPDAPPPGFAAGMTEMIGRARGYLDRALAYTLLIPKGETGIRRSCLWPLALAVLSLRKLHRRPGFRRGEEVKISRRSVRAAVLVTSALTRWNTPLRLLYRVFTWSLPPASGSSGDSSAARTARAQ